jgi:nitrate reductase molybdenum cofactor assembly chaperone NarJ/NarW
MNQHPTCQKETRLLALRMLGELLQYPDDAFPNRIFEASRLVAGNRAARAPLEEFADTLLALSGEERQELFTRTFDVTPVCVPYVSVYLFGEESFKRGEFMAGLNKRHETSGFASDGELPDHVANLLKFAAMTVEEERRELVQFCLLGPLNKMIHSLKNNSYRHVLESICAILQELYPGITPALTPLEQMQQHRRAAGDFNFSGECGCGGMAATEGGTVALTGQEKEPTRGERTL